MQPGGRLRASLKAEIEAMIGGNVGGSILPFERAADSAFVLVFLERRAAGRPISFADCQIAATARAHGAAMATRNITDFAGCGIAVIDPGDPQKGARKTT